MKLKDEWLRILKKISIPPQVLSDYLISPVIFDQYSQEKLISLLRMIEIYGYKVRHNFGSEFHRQFLREGQKRQFSDNSLSVTLHNSMMRLHLVHDQNKILFELKIPIEINDFQLKKIISSQVRLGAKKLIHNDIEFYYIGESDYYVDRFLRWNPIMDIIVRLFIMSPNGDIVVEGNRVLFIINYNNAQVMTVMDHFINLNTELTLFGELLNSNFGLGVHNKEYTNISSNYNPSSPCVICFQSIENSQKKSNFAYLICCGLNAHEDHLNEWLKIREQCPNCRSVDISVAYSVVAS